ncbi:MAG TPA: HAMP domain-containing sensor histidine kinase [Solirubrobacteraceae bacterium]|nr:HAMP domain-containing sensor histidine kinase [Solirubrobacteraceae bacterium]
MTWRRAFGLRTRLVVALVVTSAATLLVAALILLGPLQSRLRKDSAANLQNAALAMRPEFQRAITHALHGPRSERDISLLDGASAAARSLRTRTDARVVVSDSIPREIYDTDTDEPFPELAILRGLRLGRTIRSTRGGQASVVVQLFPGSDKHQYVLYASKRFTDVARVVHQVRNAFIVAAFIGLGVALILGLALAATLTRRLARLRSSALRITAEGPDAPVPRDESADEVGDLARSLARMQLGLRRQEEARRAFVSTASHELRTPLTSLSGTLELLAEDLAEGRLDVAEAQRLVSGAQSELRRLGNLATELLDLSRLDADVPLRTEPVELSELCRAVLAEFELQAGERDIELDVVPPPGPCWGAGDPGAVARIVRILVDNALKFAPPGEAIRVTPAYHGDHATVEVADTGPGVPPPERERIFERFQRGAASREGGFGLGLAIGRELAERQGGALELLDSARGARFLLSLPIELPAGSAAEPEPAARAHAAAGRTPGAGR